MSTDADIAYRVNGRDEIISVSDSWEGFARANLCVGLAPENVLGRPLWQFVTEPTTEHLYRQVLGQVRAGRAVAFPFRCDSPEYRRFMEMKITPGAGGEVLFETRVVRLERRPPQELLGRAAHGVKDLLRACGWCRRVEVGGAWEEVEEAVRKLKLFEREALPSLTHGMCEACFREISSKLAEWRSRG